MTLDVDRVEAGYVELDGNELGDVHLKQIFPMIEVPVEIEDEFLEGRGSGMASGVWVKVWE